MDRRAGIAEIDKSGPGLPRRDFLKLIGLGFIGGLVSNSQEASLIARASAIPESAEKEFLCQIDLSLVVVRTPESFRPSLVGLRYLVWGYGSDPGRDGVIYRLVKDQGPQEDSSKLQTNSVKESTNQFLKAQPNGDRLCPDGSCKPTTVVYVAQLNELGVLYPVTPIISGPIDCVDVGCQASVWIKNEEKASFAPSPTVIPTQPSPRVVIPKALPKVGGGP